MGGDRSHDRSRDGSHDGSHGRVSDGVGGMTPGSACVLVVKGRRRVDGQFAFITEDVFVLQVVQNKHGSRQQLRTLFPKKTFFFISGREFRPDEVVGRNVLVSFSAEPE